MLKNYDTKKLDKMELSNWHLVLDIYDKNIIFDENPLKLEKMNNIQTKVFYAKLTYTPKACPVCGCINAGGKIIKYGAKSSDIQLIPYQNYATILRLSKQRFECKECCTTFSAETDLVDANCYISKKLKLAIACDLTLKISMKDIAYRYFVSTKTVERVLIMLAKRERFNPDYLPKQLMIDEFKGTKDCTSHMCFIASDAATGGIFTILRSRQNHAIKEFFGRYSLKARRKVKLVIMDMNSSYDIVVNEVFPNAKIVTDRFHVIQQINRAFNQQRVQVMNSLRKGDNLDKQNYRKLKKYWRTLLKKESKINYSSLKQFPLFRRKYVTESEVLDYLLQVNEGLRTSYEIYQSLLSAFERKDCVEFFEIIDNTPHDLNAYFKKAITTISKHKKTIRNALKSPYSNGKLEGKNNLIKCIQRIAFGFRTFKNMKARILIQQGLIAV